MLGTTEDVFGIIAEVLSITNDVLGTIVDVSRLFVHALLYGNLVGCSLMITRGLEVHT